MYTILYSLNFGVKGYLSVLIQLFAINDISIGFLALRKNGRYNIKQYEIKKDTREQPQLRQSIGHHYCLIKTLIIGDWSLAYSILLRPQSALSIFFMVHPLLYSLSS